MASTTLTITLTPPPHLQDLHRSSAAFSILSYRKPTNQNLIFSSATQALSLSENGRLSRSFVSAAVATESEVAEEAEELQLGDDGGSVAVAVKPKKGKAALPLKRDRVCVWKGNFFFSRILKFETHIHLFAIDDRRGRRGFWRFRNWEKASRSMIWKQPYHWWSKQQAQNLLNQLKLISASILILSIMINNFEQLWAFWILFHWSTKFEFLTIVSWWWLMMHCFYYWNNI